MLVRRHRLKGSSAGSARRTRSATPRSAHCRATRACCCACCPTVTCISPMRRVHASWSIRACPAGRWRSSWCRRCRRRWCGIWRTGRSPTRWRVVRRSRLRRAGGDSAADVTGATAVVIACHGGPEAEIDPRRTRCRRRLYRLGGQQDSRRRGPGRVGPDVRSERARYTPRSGCRSGRGHRPEIAVSIAAEVIAAIRVDGLEVPSASAESAPKQAIDPVCGMSVVVGSGADRTLRSRGPGLLVLRGRLPCLVHRQPGLAHEPHPRPSPMSATSCALR